MILNLLPPCWSTFGYFGDDGDQNVFVVTTFSYFLALEQKSVQRQPLSNVDHLITCDNKDGIINESHDSLSGKVSFGF